MQLAYLPLLLVSCAVATPILTLPSIVTGFTNAKISKSAGGEATCVSGTIPITATAVNTKLLLPEPANQNAATEIFQELTQIGSTLLATTNGGPATVTGTYKINARLCYPTDLTALAKVQTLQLLTSGVGLDITYWDIAPGNSYVDAAVTAGYATLAYDRLGVGASDHPDPIQVVQSYNDVEIEHGLIQKVRAGVFGAMAFKNVVGVGHSYGSVIQVGVTSKYPKDLDAVILTGMSDTLTYLGSTILANNPAIASLNKPTEFTSLTNGYLVHDTPISIQLAFFRYPNFDINLFNAQYATKQLYTLGQIFSIGGVMIPAPSFTGPVNVVLGQHDFPFCMGDCNTPTNRATAVKTAFYPAAGAGSQSYIVPNTGHNINAHLTAAQAFTQMIKFLQANNI